MEKLCEPLLRTQCIDFRYLDPLLRQAISKTIIYYLCKLRYDALHNCLNQVSILIKGKLDCLSNFFKFHWNKNCLRAFKRLDAIFRFIYKSISHHKSTQVDK